MDGLGAAAGIRGGFDVTYWSYAASRPLDRHALQFLSNRAHARS